MTTIVDRLRMLGNAWHIPVAKWFVWCLLFPAGAKAEHVACAGDPLWDKRGADWVDAYMDKVPEPLRTESLPYRQFFQDPWQAQNITRGWLVEVGEPSQIGR